uniref:Uncharacterized protein n=1 Tax=Arundo donax TaxID=35708 RepID=A0A0A8Y740_ARUDO
MLCLASYHPRIQSNFSQHCQLLLELLEACCLLASQPPDIALASHFLNINGVFKTCVCSGSCREINQYLSLWNNALGFNLELLFI